MAIKNGTLNKSLSKAKFLPFGEASMEILEGSDGSHLGRQWVEKWDKGNVFFFNIL